MHRALAVVLAIAAPTVVGAQVVMGRVVDARTGQPLPVAGVGVRLSPDSVVRTRTGQDGVFALELGTAGRYVVHIQASLETFVASDTIDVPKDSVVQREFRVPMPADPTFLESQVEEHVAPIPGTTGPRYPQYLKAQDVDGAVFVSVVIDTAGRADTTTIRVVQTTHAGFAEAVRDALPRMRFTPARRQGRAVRELVEQPFTFCLPALQRKEGPCAPSAFRAVPPRQPLESVPPND